MSQTNAIAELSALKTTVKHLVAALDATARTKFHKSIDTEIYNLQRSASPHGSDLSNQELAALREIALSLGWIPTR